MAGKKLLPYNHPKEDRESMRKDRCRLAGLDIMSRQLSGGREVKPAPDPDLLNRLLKFIFTGDVPVALEASEVLVSAGWTGRLDEAVKSGKLSDIAWLYPALIISGREDALDLLVKTMTERGDMRMNKLYRGSQGAERGKSRIPSLTPRYA